MALEKWNLNTTSELTAEPGSPVGLVNHPPRTPQQRLDDRPADYGEQIVPPKPLWYTDRDGNPHSHGITEPHRVQLYWRSNVGEQAADAATVFLGSNGLQSIGVAGHKITVGASGDVDAPGGEVMAHITGYWDRTDPDNPVWTTIKPETSYTFTVAAYNQAGELGPASDPLTLTTPAVGYDRQHLTLPPKAPDNFEYDAPLPVIDSAAGGPITVRWSTVPGATSYEVYDNPNAETDQAMDLDRIGLNENDVLLGSVPQPSTPGTVTYTTPNYTVPGQHFALKVRAVRTDDNGTAYSHFSNLLRGNLPAAHRAPDTPPAPTLTEDPIVGGTVKLTIDPPTIDADSGAPTWYAVYDGTRKVAVIGAPLGTPPHATFSYTAGQAYSFTIVAGNHAGVSAPSAPLSGTVPA